MEKLYFIFYCIQTKIQNFNQTKNHGQVFIKKLNFYLSKKLGL